MLETIFQFVVAHFIAGTPKNLTKKYGKWAVVTGATDGIGLAMAKSFADKGMNVALIARSADKLEDCVKTLKSKFTNPASRKFETLTVDFNDINELPVRDSITRFLQDKDIGILVNNVGVSYPFAKYFHELTDSEVRAMVVVNVDSMTWMTRICLPGMLERKKGAIINVASVAGVLTSPLLAQYGGAKGYIAQMSKALHYELKSKGIYVQCQVPFYVATKLAKLRKTSLMVASADQYANSALSALYQERGIVVSPFWSHAIQLSAMQAMPEWMAAKLAEMSHLDIRRRGRKKEAEKSKSK
jgi:17beta-estradiol 17-dehydrogenase / very-long-chain 3-oxoacyl-CoA reductase